MTVDFWKRISPSVILFLFFFSLYAFTMSGRIQYGDEVEKYRVAQSIVDRHDFSFRPTAMRNQIGVGGRTYSIYEFGQTVLQVPLYGLGRLVYAVFPQPDVNWVGMLLVGFLNPILTALTCVVLFKTGLGLGFQYRTALILMLVFGLGTIALPYSKDFTREPLLGLMILLTVYALHRFQTSRYKRWLIAAGAAAGYLVFSKFIQAALVPFFVIYMFSVIFQNQREIGAKAAGILLAMTQGLVLFGLPTIAFMAFQSLYALSRFGTIYSGIAGTAVNPFSAILSLLAISQPAEIGRQIFFTAEKSLFLYSPPAVLFLVGWFAWVRNKPKEVLMVLGLILVTVVSVLARYDGHGGDWWGPRYLVQITPLLILPLGALVELPNRTARRFWSAALGLLFAIGLGVNVVGAFSNDRDYLDITGTGTNLLGQLDFLRHGALDSLVLYLSPTGFPIQINPYGIVLITIVFLLGLVIVEWTRRGVADSTASVCLGFLFASLVLVIESVAFIAWVVAPYPQIRAAQGNTRFVAANRFLADGRTCEAISLYLLALERGTTYQREAAAQIEQLWPRAEGKRLAINNPSLWVDSDNGGTVAEDSSVTITGDGSMRFTAVPGEDASISITSEPLSVLPNTQYELSGWIKSTAIYGTGYGVVTVFEDDGNWGSGRITDIKALDETSGWQPIRGILTTLSTTRRIFVKAGLYKTYGTSWVDGVQLVQIDPSTPRPAIPLPPCGR